MDEWKVITCYCGRFLLVDLRTGLTQHKLGHFRTKEDAWHWVAMEQGIENIILNPMYEVKHDQVR